MQSSAAMDSSFPTTFGFHPKKGFEVLQTISPLTRSSLSVSPSLHKELLEPQLPDGLRRPDNYDPRASMPAASMPDSNKGSVGWKGLLEMSRNSGASGIVGVQRSVEDPEPPKLSQIEVCATAHTNPAIRRLVKSVIRGITACQEPERTAEGMGGTYFFCNENGRKVAILKPCDEEPLAPNNPKGYVGRSLGDPGWKPTVRVGEAAMREVAAYLLDKDSFAKVPTSVLVRARHPIFCYNNIVGSVRSCSTVDLGLAEAAISSALPMKLGSLQEFVPHECDTTEMGPSRFSCKDVHHIGILDIRLFNTDRHSGNMLVRSVGMGSSSNLMACMTDSQYELVPIDHGFCLPETLEAPYFEWLHWPQAMLPFSEEELAYIRDLDIQADKDMLSQELPNLRPECSRVLELTTALLKRCADAGMTLYEIGNLMSRPFVGGDEEPSELERMCDEAKRAMEMPEIVEEDEESNDFCEGLCSEELAQEEGDVPLQLVGQLFDRRKKKDDLDHLDSLIFELEETAGNFRLASTSPKPDLSDSHGSHPASSMSSSYSSRLTENVASLILTAMPLTNVRTGAQSVHVADGYMWRVSSQRRLQMSKNIRKQKLASPQAYPSKATLTGGPIKIGEFDEDGWIRFKQELLHLIDANLESGRWRQASREASGMGVAMSCPRF